MVMHHDLGLSDFLNFCIFVCVQLVSLFFQFFKYHCVCQFGAQTVPLCQRVSSLFEASSSVELSWVHHYSLT